MIAIAMLISAVVTLVRAEVHTLTFVNNCHVGVPQFVRSPGTLATETSSSVWTSNIPGYLNGIAWLDWDDNMGCGLDVDDVKCPHVTVNLDNNHPVGQSSASINIPKEEYYGGIKYRFTGGSNGDCDSIAAGCYNQACVVQNECDDNDVNLEITFCA